MSSVAQVLRQADTLKTTISDSGKNISELWVTRQRLEDLYKKILLMDLEYALDKKVEQDLWNHAFKNQINILQTQAKDKQDHFVALQIALENLREFSSSVEDHLILEQIYTGDNISKYQNVKRGEVQASLNLFLETASGFYLQFLQQICTTFKLDLPFRRKSAVFGLMKEKCPLKTRITPPKKSSCLYVCQHCLVHLGDIARYRQQVEQAQTYYQHAANLVPQNGQPYNQLAILEAARGNKLSTVFYYIRSLAVRHPFPVAATNLEKFYAKLTKDIGEVKDKLSMSEVINAFLQFTALTHLSSDLNKASSLKEKLLSSLPAHVISQSFTSNVLIQFVAITIFSLHHVQKELNAGLSNHGSVSKDEQRCFNLMFSFMISVLEILLQNTPKQEPKAREFFTLPAIKIIFDWLHLNKDCIDKRILMSSGFWSSLAKLLNNLQTLSNKENTPDSVKYEDVPLPEDCEVRCFQPIEKAHSNYSFSRVSVDSLPSSVEAHLRYQRLIEHGKWLAMEFSSSNVFFCITLKSGHLQFSPGIQNREISGGITEKKFGRQNVAMQAIILKQEKQDAADVERATPTKMNDSPGLYEIDRNVTQTIITGQTSPKYFLGIPTNEPQFMKMKHVKTPTTASTHLRFNGSNIQHSPPYSGYSSPSQTNGSNAQQHMGYSGRNSNQPTLPPRMTPGGQGQCITPGNQGSKISPGNQSNAPGTSPTGNIGPGISPQSIPQHPPFMMQPPVFTQSDPYQMTPPMPGSMIGSPVSTPEGQTGPMISPAQQQIRAAMMRQPPPTLPLSNLSPNQIIAAMALTNQMNAQQQQQMIRPNQQQTASSQMQHHLFQQAPGTERTQTSPKDQQSVQSVTALKTAFPALTGSPGFAGLTGQGSPMGAPPFRHAPPPMTNDGQTHPTMFVGFNPLTIQPPRPPFQDTRLNSSFQGHAEGTPKPGGYYPERSPPRVREVVGFPVTTRVPGLEYQRLRDGESVSKTDGQPTSQPGVYSLFSNSPWAVPISAAGDSKSLGSSPFSSAASSIRNSPEHSTELPTTGPPAFDLGLRFSSSDAHWGAQVTNELQNAEDSNQYLNSIQSIWNASAPSPLERLLEQQKQKRQNEPH